MDEALTGIGNFLADSPSRGCPASALPLSGLDPPAKQIRNDRNQAV
jgi:hypothetical protein